MLSFHARLISLWSSRHVSLYVSVWGSDAILFALYALEKSANTMMPEDSCWSFFSFTRRNRVKIYDSAHTHGTYKCRKTESNLRHIFDCVVRRRHTKAVLASHRQRRKSEHNTIETRVHAKKSIRRNEIRFARFCFSLQSIACVTRSCVCVCRAIHDSTINTFESVKCVVNNKRNER